MTGFLHPNAPYHIGPTAAHAGINPTVEYPHRNTRSASLPSARLRTVPAADYHSKMQTRSGSLWRGVCWCLIACSLLSLIVSAFSVQRIEWTTGRLIAPVSPSAPAGAPGWWTYRLNTPFIVLTRGSLSFGVDSYDSLWPDAEALTRQWQPSLGFGHHSHAASPGPAPIWFAWQPQRKLILCTGYETGSRQGVETRMLVIPLWMLLILASLPLLVSHRRRRNLGRRLAQGHCVRCGYDRSTVGTEFPCPECGTPGFSPPQASSR